MRKSAPKNRRVVVTGIGCLTPVGHGKDAFFSALLKGESGIAPITKFPTEGYTTTIAGELKDFRAEDFMEKKAARRMDSVSRYAVAASRMAWEDSGLSADAYDPYRCGTILGTGIGGIETFEEGEGVLLSRGPSRVSPFVIPMLIPNMVSGMVSIDLNLKGSSMSVSTACSSGTHAIGEAYRMIRYGYLDMAVTGGAEAPISPLALSGFGAMKAMSTRNEEPTRAVRPFDATRDGFVMGEGAGVVILESLESATARGAHIYGEVLGYGSTSDAFHMTAPDEEGRGACKAMQLAVEEAEIELTDVDYINAHGTSTPLNDRIETRAIRDAFGEHANKLAISSTKSMTGHLLGAAGGIEAIASLLTIESGIIPPTINYENPDPDCDLFYTPNEAVERTVRYALSNTLGFGGHNGTLAFGKVE